MKKIFIYLCIIICPLLLSQEVEGLGVFKLGKFKETQIDSIATKNQIRIEDCDNYNCELQAGYKVNIKRLKPNKDETYKSPTEASYSDNISIYSFNNYNLNERYKSDRIILSFYKSTLYKISIYRPDIKLVDDLEVKFGKGELKKRESKDKCRIEGKSIELPSSVYTKNWINKNKNFDMTYMLMDGYNSDCKERIITSLYLLDNNIYTIAKEENYTEQKKYQKIIEEKKKETLKDL